MYERGVWQPRFVCRHEIDPDTPGDGVAGTDLGISNFAAVSFGDETVLYPGGALKQDEHWFYKKRATRRSHFLHAVTRDAVERCADRGVGTIVVGDLGGIRDGTDWDDTGNLDLHGWAFDRFTVMLEYKVEAPGIDVEQVDERGTSTTCSTCGTEDNSQRVERRLCVYDKCGLVANADCNGAENIRQKVLPNLATDGGRDRDTGWMAQPAVRLFDKSTGRVRPREQVDGTPQYSTRGRDPPASSGYARLPEGRSPSPFTPGRMS